MTFDIISLYFICSFILLIYIWTQTAKHFCIVGFYSISLSKNSRFLKSFIPQNIFPQCISIYLGINQPTNFGLIYTIYILFKKFVHFRYKKNILLILLYYHWLLYFNTVYTLHTFILKKKALYLNASVHYNNNVT